MPSTAWQEADWDDFPLKLHAAERYWKAQYDIFLARGYVLRNRFKPGEVDDWLNGKIDIDIDEADRRGLTGHPVRLCRVCAKK